MSWVMVLFPECREVFIDTFSYGNNIDAAGKVRALLVGAGPHTFTLGGAPTFTPATQTLIVLEAPLLDPFPVVFTKAV